MLPNNFPIWLALSSVFGVTTAVSVRRLRLLGEINANAVIRSREHHELQHAYQKIQELKTRLENENIQLNGELDSILGNPEIIGSTPVMQGLSQ
jgi:hypothetical protein